MRGKKAPRHGVGSTLTRLARPIEQATGLLEIVYHTSFKLRKSKGGIILEFKLTLPGGAVIEYRKEPLSKERFEMICWLIGVIVIGSGIIHLISLSARR